MGESEDEQPKHAPVVQGDGSPAAGFGPVREQADPGAEQHGENGDELGVGQEMTDEPGHEVDTGQVTPCRRVQIGGFGHREHLDVHDQDAQHREAAQDVQAGDAASGDGGGGGSMSGVVHAIVSGRAHRLVTTTMPARKRPAAGDRAYRTGSPGKVAGYPTAANASRGAPDMRGSERAAASPERNAPCTVP